MRIVAWCVVVALLGFSVFCIATSYSISKDLGPDGGLALYASSPTLRAFARALEADRDARRAEADIGLWVGLGSGAVAIVGFIVLAATAKTSEQ